MSPPVPNNVADKLAQQASSFIQAGRLGAARTVLAALAKRDESHSAISTLDVRLCLAEGDVARALTILNASIADDPTNPTQRLMRAEARARLDDLEGAAQDAAEAVLLAPGEARAKAMLGLTLIELGQNDDAVICLRDAVRGAPSNPAPWQGLAEAMSRQGAQHEVDGVFDAAIARIPRHAGLRVSAMMSAMRMGNLQRVVTLGAAASSEGIADACCFGLLGHALSSLGCHVQAAGAYHDALRLAPEDPYVRHLVRAAGLLPGSESPPAAYLQAVFDGCAGRFEQDVIGLGYRIPGIVRSVLVDMLEREPGRTLGRVLDLGCGTGLVGMMLAELPVGDLVGVDISSAMLAEARGKNIYDELVHQDMIAYVKEEGGLWDVMIAADAFCYLGPIDHVLALCAARMRLRGRIIFSIERYDSAEICDGQGWILGPRGRYLHGAEYVLRCIRAAGLEVVVLRNEVIRMEAGVEVAGLLVVASNVSADV